MKCSKCENEGRYLRADGKFYCSLHTMGHFALRLSDIGIVLDDIFYVTHAEFHPSSVPRVNEAKARIRAMLGMLPQNCQTVELGSTDDDRSP